MTEEDVIIDEDNEEVIIIEDDNLIEIDNPDAPSDEDGSDI